MTPKAVKLQYFLLFFAFAGCLGQVPAPESTETPEPARTSTPTPTPFDPSGQIAELDNYGRELGLSQETLGILRSAYSGGKASDEYKNTLKDVMLSISQIPEKYGTHKFREGATKRVMEDKRITDEDKKSVIEYGNLVKSNITQMEELKKDDFILEDGKQTEIEKSFLENPNDPKLAQELKKYYLSEIEKMYPELASELKKLPDLAPLEVDKKSLETLEDIYALLLTAKPYANYNDRFKSNIPKENETWEAFELMIKGGTPDPKDYQYTVPNYNTELQALLWIAQQNEFKKNDTLVQSIAMDNGLWITVGDEQVRTTVYKDMDGLLEFFRETNLWQLENGFYLLEEYPLEAKVALSWTGNDNANHGWKNLLDYKNKFLDLDAYSWINIYINNLEDMQKLLLDRFPIEKDVKQNINSIENYFYLYGPNWNFVESLEERILVRGKLYPARNINNPNFEFEYFKKFGKGIGVCEDNMTLVGNFLKSIGIPSDPVMHYWKSDYLSSGHTYNIYYDPLSNSWLAHKIQIGAILSDPPSNSVINFYIFQPPINQRNYLQIVNHEFTGDPITNSYYSFFKVNPTTIYNEFIEGVQTPIIKKYILYSLS